MAKILIAEDDPSLATMYETELSARGHKVLFATDGEQALKIAEGQSPDMVLLDIMMPVMTGLEVLEKLKRGKSKAVRVLVLTNFGQRENVQKALDLGAEDFVLKYRTTPYEVGEKVAKVLGSK